MSEQLEPLFREPIEFTDPIEAALQKVLGATDPKARRNPLVDRMMATIVATTDCPYCARPAGELCVQTRTGIDIAFPHPDRGYAWKREHR